MSGKSPQDELMEMINRREVCESHILKPTSTRARGAARGDCTSTHPINGIQYHNR
ncbi:hypothetical protein NQZ68_024605 [Dissostichus eleginoides]|nr:hypothetical protein NQZ68_024605 [Dissostichus eleginoides]